MKWMEKNKAKWILYFYFYLSCLELWCRSLPYSIIRIHGNRTELVVDCGYLVLLLAYSDEHKYK